MPDAALVLSGVVRRGKLHVRRWRGLDRWRDGEVTVTIARKHAVRSVAQNAYYWGVVLDALAEATGYTQDELHEYAKLRFNAERLILTNRQGEVVDERRIGQSTTALDKIKFGEYLEAVRCWAARDLGVVIPNPDPGGAGAA